MKFLKYALITLILAVITDLTLVFAYDTGAVQSIHPELSGNNTYYTSYYTKTYETRQRYYNESTYTGLTNPCPDCKVQIRLHTDDGDFSIAYLSKTGSNTRFTDSTVWYLPNNYRLSLKRFDFSLLTTYHFGLWYVNSAQDA